MSIETATITGQNTMSEVLEAYPGAQRALFRRYHIGGCSSCGFQPTETLGQVCHRNNNLDVEEVLSQIKSSHEQDSRILISPSQLAQFRQENQSLKLLDVRSREEWEAARIEGAILLSQQAMQEILSQWPREELFVIYDHEGKQGLDAAAYFIGHGFENVRCLKGGIDAWSEQIDPNIPRYLIA
jgi:rhodanese-related sulfurtransferase